MAEDNGADGGAGIEGGVEEEEAGGAVVDTAEEKVGAEVGAPHRLLLMQRHPVRKRE